MAVATTLFLTRRQVLYAGEPVHPPGTQRERQGRAAVPHRREPPRRGLLHRTGSARARCLPYSS
ncbi:hypothetical protein QUB80_13990 [Chlorogloeopsis sp. ULAP01]|uniref:hypothetical protein n=1 Tax=Chlorogloeopsis sp. ULAP01 TaxID=3056483 RepID=UPI0025AA3C4F|nr:hypothetical protein [Chlorogloeopsis sp. ULAP01]MDM9381813.1 hypothetical protein [Chlorogloeopsis sp. ULAP01]